MEAAGAPQDPAPPAESATADRKRSGTHSGKLLLRMPEQLHAELARASERAGMSLNAFINDALAQALGHRGAARRAGTSRPQPREGRRRLVERLLVLNVVVLAAVGVLAIVLLIQALR
jgi:HicB family